MRMRRDGQYGEITDYKGPWRRSPGSIWIVWAHPDYSLLFVGRVGPLSGSERHLLPLNWMFLPCT